MGFKYSPIEDKYIQNNYSSMSDLQIGKKLGRPEFGIERRRILLGFYRQEDLSATRMQRLRISKHSELTSLRLFLNKNIMTEAVINRINDLQNDLPNFYRIREKHLEHPLKLKAKVYKMLVFGHKVADLARRFEVSEWTIRSWKSQFMPYLGENSITITLPSKI